MSKQSNALQKARIPKKIRTLGRRIGESASELGRDVQNIQELMRNKRRRFEMGGLPKNAFDYENELLQTVDDSIKRRLKFRYGNAIKPWIGLGGVAYMQSQSNPTTKKRLKKGLVNPVLHEIRQANPAPTRKSVKYSTSTYPDSVQGMAGQGYNRNSNKLRQLMEDASTLATGGRPNPEHNAKRFYGLYGQSAVNEPQKSMTQARTMQREINQSLRSGHSNRRVAKSSLKKASYNNVFVSGSAVDPNVIVQPKKGRRFKGQTTGMMLVSKRAKLLNKNTSNKNPNPQDGDEFLSSLLFPTNTTSRTKNTSTTKNPTSTSSTATSTLNSGTPAYTAYTASSRPSTSVKPKKTTLWGTISNKLADAEDVITGTAKNSWQSLNRNLANLERNVVNTVSRNKRTYVPPKNTATTRAPIPSTPTRGATTPDRIKTPDKIETPDNKLLGTLLNNTPASVNGARKPFSGARKAFKGFGAVNILSDALSSLGTLYGLASALKYTNVQNKTNPYSTYSNASEKPILVNNERYDFRDESKINPVPRSSSDEDLQYANAYLDYIMPESVSNVGTIGDSDAYQSMSLEQLPRREREEQGRFSTPIESRIHGNSNFVRNSVIQEGVNLLDPTGLTGMVMGQNVYNDYGEPILGGNTLVRTTLGNALGKKPQSVLTGWAASNSRDGQKSLSAQGAINLHKNKYAQELNSINDEYEKKQRESLSMDPDEAKAELDKLNRRWEDALASYKALQQIGSRVNSVKGLQREIDVAKATNNKAVLSLLTNSRTFSGDKIDTPSVYDMSGYQNSLRRAHLSRVGDEYGPNLVPFSVRSDQPQTTHYGSNIADKNQLALNILGSFVGLNPYGTSPVSEVDNDWYIGAGLSNYQGNDPKYKNINTQAVYVDNDNAVQSTDKPINPATGQPVDYRNLFLTGKKRVGDSLQGLASIPIALGDMATGGAITNLTNPNTEKRLTKKTSLSSKTNKVSKKQTVKKSSLTNASPMQPMSNTSPIKINNTSSTTQSNEMFAKSLSVNPKPIEQHSKHKNKYFK